MTREVTSNVFPGLFRAVRPRHWLAAVCAICSAAAAGAQELSDLPAQLGEKAAAAKQACADFENGEFVLAFGAVRRVDLDGDLDPDWVLNEAGFACSTAASLFCGTGGCMSHFLVGDRVASVLNQGWEMVTIGRHRVLLADIHGSRCDGIGPTPCVAASVWDAEETTWRSTEVEWE